MAREERRRGSPPLRIGVDTEWADALEEDEAAEEEEPDDPPPGASHTLSDIRRRMGALRARARGAAAS